METLALPVITIRVLLDCYRAVHTKLLLKLDKGAIGCISNRLNVLYNKW